MSWVALTGWVGSFSTERRSKIVSKDDIYGCAHRELVISGVVPSPEILTAQAEGQGGEEVVHKGQRTYVTLKADHQLWRAGRYK